MEGISSSPATSAGCEYDEVEKEAPFKMLKTFEEKITYAIEKVKQLKEEKFALEKKIEELEDVISVKDQEIEKLTLEKAAVKAQIEDLFNELESIELK